jgi:hypothetical protein
LKKIRRTEFENSVISDVQVVHVLAVVRWCDNNRTVVDLRIVARCFGRSKGGILDFLEGIRVIHIHFLLDGRIGGEVVNS